MSADLARDRVRVGVRARDRVRVRVRLRVRVRVRLRLRLRLRARSASTSLRSFALSSTVTVLSLTLVLTAFARCAKRRVVWHSSMFSSSVRSVTTMLALQLPPRLSCSRRVSFESRHGMCALCPALESFSMTEPSE